MSGLGRRAGNLALWLHLRRKPGAADGSTAPSEVMVPSGSGALLWVHLPAGEEDPAALTPLIAALLSARRDLRIAFSGGQRRPSENGNARSVNLPDLTTTAEVKAAIKALSPAALLLLGADLPAALIAGAHEADVPIILAEARLGGTHQGGLWQESLLRGLLSRIDSVLAPDLQSSKLALRMGVDPFHVEMIGPVTDTRAPLRGNEAERQALASVFQGRHIWLAATPTLPEALAALAAHHDALQYNHRALLVIAGPPEGSLPELLRSCEELGMAAILRSDDDDPQPDDHVLVAEEDDEMGLWYRLAPVTFLGSTLIAGQALPPRHPFEPAALGSAIIHGPLPGGHEAELAQLDGAQAARKIEDAAALKQAVSDLSSAEQAADLARNAWVVSTGGAAVLRRIVSEVLTVMERKT